MFGRFVAARFGTMLICESAFGYGRITTERVRGWNVETDRRANACTAVGPRNRDGTQLSFRWDLAARDWIIGISNPDWDLDRGYRIGARIFVDRRYLTEDRLHVRSSDRITLRLPKGETSSNRVIYGALAAGRNMELRWSGGTVTRVSLTGTHAALSVMDRCVARIRRSRCENVIPPRPKPATLAAKFRKLDVSREDSVKVVKQVYNSQKHQITFLPPSIKKSDLDIVRYRFRNGDLGWFRAQRSSPPDADRNTAALLAERLAKCLGRFFNEIEKIASTDGRLIRVVRTSCVYGDKLHETTTAVIRYPEGLLVEINRSSESPHKKPEKKVPEKEWQKTIPTETVHAAVSLIK